MPSILFIPYAKSRLLPHWPFLHRVRNSYTKEENSLKKYHSIQYCLLSIFDHSVFISSSEKNSSAYLLLAQFIPTDQNRPDIQYSITFH